MRGARGISLKIRLGSHWARVQASVEAESRKDSLGKILTTEITRDMNLLI